MTICNLGSINVDHVYRVPHLPGPGETLEATGYATGLGGKGANQSVAAARAGARVRHIGAVGPEGGWARDRLAGFGVDVTHVATGAVPTGHAVITVDPAAENAIVIYPGANRALDPAAVRDALGAAGPDDTLLIQNETALQAEAAALGARRGLRVIYSAAPFDVVAVAAVMADIGLLMVNAVEAAQLCRATGRTLEALPVRDIVVTEGASGATWHRTGESPLFVPAFAVDPVDTTGAGDCFAGTLAATLDAGAARAAAMRRAAAAAALQVTRHGAAEAMPDHAEVTAFLADRPG